MIKSESVLLRVLRLTAPVIFAAAVMLNVTYGWQYSTSHANEFVSGIEHPPTSTPNPPGTTGPPDTTDLIDPRPPGATFPPSETSRPPDTKELTDPRPPGAEFPPRTGDFTDARIWLTVLLVSAIALRRLLFFNKTSSRKK